jgi:hypothetical protein
MNLLRLGDVREPLSRVLNLCPTDDLVRRYANEADARLVNKGKFVNTTQSYRICTSKACLTWPRQINTIEAWARCQFPGQIRNRWYMYAGNGPGIISEDSNWFTTMVDTDPACAFDDIDTDTLTKRIKVTADFQEAAGARILLQGYDQNAQWITSIDGGTRIDGEYVTINNIGTYLSRNYFTSLQRVQKPVTNGPVRLWEWEETAGQVIKQLAYYEPSETLPWYRRSFLPGLGGTSACGSCGDCGDTAQQGCDNKTVTVMAKLKHIDVVVDNDFLLLGSLGALKLMAMAIIKEERNLLNEAAGYEANATRLLDEELKSYEGDGALPVIKTEDRETFGAGVRNVVGNDLWQWGWGV